MPERKRILVVGGSAAGPKAAARVLMGKGWTKVKVMEGGLMAWPYPREK
jgi:rhodanese-related sulfurtransferase